MSNENEKLITPELFEEAAKELQERYDTGHLKQDKDYLLIDEVENFAFTIESAASIALLVKDTPLQWKWLIIMLHDALQGAMVCALCDSMRIGALEQKSIDYELENQFNEHDKDVKHAKPPKQRLADFKTLYKRCKDPKWKIPELKKPLETNEQEDLAVKRLNSFRNMFEHFPPTSWMIEKEGLPDIVSNVIDVIDRLGDKINTTDFSPKCHQRVKDALEKIREADLS